MTDEILAVERTLNQDLALSLMAGGLDYRIIMVSRHGSAASTQSICVSQPLSGSTTCSPAPPMPTNGPRYFHDSVEVGSVNGLSVLLSSYNSPGLDGTAPQGWNVWLRAGAFRAFVAVTDDNSPALSASVFDQRLLALSPSNFGTATNRLYAFHSVIGISPRVPAGTPYLPTEGPVTNLCAEAVNVGAVYQDLSRLTGGLRFSVCDTPSFGSVFRNLASSIAMTVPPS